MTTHNFPPQLNDKISKMVQSVLIAMPPNKQAEFWEEYERKEKSVLAAYLLFLCGCHYAYLGKWGTQVLFWFTVLLFVGLVWWLVDVFRVNDFDQRL